MVNVLDLAEQDTRLHRASLREMAGPCPNPACHCRNDGFHVDAERNPVYRRSPVNGEWEVDEEKAPLGGFRCRGCWPSEEFLPDGRKRGWGKPFDYLCHVRKMSKREAFAYLTQLDEGGYPAPKRERSGEKRYDYTIDAWQDTTHAAVEEAIARLWNPSDTTALDYLHARGFNDEIIRRARLGYSLHEGVPRLIIPSVNAGRYVAIYRRNLRPDVSHAERWKDAPGGTKSEMYLADCLRRKLPTIITEAPLDALTLVQECVHAAYKVNVIATGGTNCAKEVKWLVRLAQMPCVFLGFDADTSGDLAAQWWLERLPHARRLRPLLHDFNDMLIQHWDIGGWIQENFLAACAVCSRPIAGDRESDELHFFSDENGTLYCQDHWQRSPEQDSCKEQLMESKITLCPEQAMTYEMFLHIVANIIACLPVACTITTDPPGYTLADRAREVAREQAARERAIFIRHNKKVR